MGVPGLYVQQQLDHHGIYAGIIPVMFSDVMNHNLSSSLAKTITFRVQLVLLLLVEAIYWHLLIKISKCHLRLPL